MTPGYPPMRVAFAAAGGRITSAAVHEEGMIAEVTGFEFETSIKPFEWFEIGGNVA